MLVADADAMTAFSALHDRKTISSRAMDAARALPNLTAAQRLLAEVEKKAVGRSSAGSLAVALELCKTMKNKNLLIIFYDNAAYYANSD